MQTDGAPSLRILAARAIRRRCPRCGAGGAWRSWLRQADACGVCGQRFQRGEAEDFFIGAYLLNLVVAESSAVVVVAVLWLAFGARLSFNVLWGIAMALAVVMPVLFFPYARGLWLAVDLYFRPHEAGDRHDAAPPPPVSAGRS